MMTPDTLIMETYPGIKSRYNPVLPLYPVKDGYITAPDKPGLGIDPDPELVKKVSCQLILTDRSVLNKIGRKNV